MKIGRHIVQVLFLFGLWLGQSLSVHAQTDKVTYVYSDPQGTPLAEADAQGHIIARYDYTPYGVAVPSLGNPPDGPGYTGHVNDPETGLVYMQARYYDPASGQFLSVDPVMPSPENLFNFNRYDYASNNPIVNVDPTGKESSDISYRSTESLTKAMEQHPDEAKYGLIMAGAVYGGAAVMVAGPELSAGGVVRAYRAW